MNKSRVSAFGWWTPGKEVSHIGENDSPVNISEESNLTDKPSLFGFSFWILFFLLAMAMPSSTSFYLGPVRLTIYRLLLIIAFLPCLIKLTSSKDIKPQIFDVLMFIHSVWPVFALSANHGFSKALETGGITFLESFAPYLIARCYITDLKTFRNVVYFLSTMVITVGALAIPEALTGQHYVRNLFAASTPFIEKRMGLERAFVSFDHPIHYGVFCSSVFGLFWYGAARTFNIFRKAGTGLFICLSTFLALSSGPLSALAVQITLTSWDIILNFSKNRWKFLLGLAVTTYLFIDLLSNRSPMKVFFSYLTLNPATAYTRIILWEWGSQDVVNNPIFGIGFNEWSKPSWMHGSSLDAFWLLLAIRFGLPTVLSLIFCILLIYYHFIKSPKTNKTLFGYQMGWMISVTGLSISAIAVHYWNALYIYFSFLIGMGVSLVNSEKDYD